VLPGRWGGHECLKKGTRESACHFQPIPTSTPSRNGDPDQRRSPSSPLSGQGYLEGKLKKNSRRSGVQRGGRVSEKTSWGEKKKKDVERELLVQGQNVQGNEKRVRRKAATPVASPSNTRNLRRGAGLVLG